MAINYVKNCIFIHIPKTAGTSMEEALGIDITSYRTPDKKRLYGMLDGIAMQHYTAKQVRDIIEPEIFNNYFKFAFVRNPYDRVVSEWLWHLSVTGWKYYSLDSFIKNMDKMPAVYRDHITPQHEFVYDGGELIVDFVGRYEKLAWDWEYVRASVYQISGLELKKKLPIRMASGQRKNWESYHNPKTRSMIYERYQKDFELFDYKK